MINQSRIRMCKNGKTPKSKNFADLISAISKVDAGMLIGMSPVEAVTKLETIRTPWVQKVLNKQDIKTTKSRPGYGKRILNSQQKGGYLKEEWATLGMIQFQLDKERVRPTTPAEYRRVIIESITKKAYLRMMEEEQARVDKEQEGRTFK